MKLEVRTYDEASFRDPGSRRPRRRDRGRLGADLRADPSCPRPGPDRPEDPGELARLADALRTPQAGRRAGRQTFQRHPEDRATTRRDDRPGLRGARRDEQEGHRWRPHRRLLLGGQEQDGGALHRRPRRQLRDGLHRRPRLDVRGRRARAVPAVLQGRAEAERRPATGVPERPAGARVVQAADQEPRRLQGHEVPPDRDQR